MENRLLIVDDNELNLRVVGNLMQTDGLKLSFARSGKEALQLLEKRNIDIVLLDISMPGMDGYEVCIKMKENEKTKDIPIIFLTARDQTADIIKAFELGAVDYVTKPFNRNELSIRVHTHLKLKNSTDTINIQKKELEEKNQILEIQKKEIQEQHENILSGIRYAKMIQKAIFPSIDILKKYFSEFFILDAPKDIVSGDFYWFKEIDGVLAIVVADSTGHGIPGAFMSILGISGLNEISNTIENFEKSGPSQILNALRESIKNALNQNSADITVRDGIDLAICIIDFNKKILKYAGANNSLYLIRKTTGVTQLQRLKPDKMPVSVFSQEVPFTEKILEIEQGDIIYMLSDGYADQFGGDLNKKFLTKNIENLFLKNFDKNLEDQKTIFYDTFTKWKGQNEQIDDVLLLGVRI